MEKFYFNRLFVLHKPRKEAMGEARAQNHDTEYRLLSKQEKRKLFLKQKTKHIQGILGAAVFLGIFQYTSIYPYLSTFIQPRIDRFFQWLVPEYGPPLSAKETRKVKENKELKPLLDLFVELDRKTFDGVSKQSVIKTMSQVKCQGYTFYDKNPSQTMALQEFSQIIQFCYKQKAPNTPKEQFIQEFGLNLMASLSMEDPSSLLEAEVYQEKPKEQENSIQDQLDQIDLSIRVLRNELEKLQNSIQQKNSEKIESIQREISDLLEYKQKLQQQHILTINQIYILK